MFANIKKHTLGIGYVEMWIFTALIFGIVLLVDYNHDTIMVVRVVSMDVLGRA